MKNVNYELREAAEEGNEEWIKTLLLDPKCNPKNTQIDRTALMSAAAYGHASCVQLLLPVSDALAKDRDGWSALIYATSGGRTSCVQMLLPVSDALAKDKAGWTALMYAARGGEAFCLELLLPVSDALAKDKAGWTALMYAAVNRETSCLKLLLPVSDALAKNLQGETASAMATTRGYLELREVIDAFVLSVTEREVLDSSTSFATARKPRSLRV